MNNIHLATLSPRRVTRHPKKCVVLGGGAFGTGMAQVGALLRVGCIYTHTHGIKGILLDVLVDGVSSILLRSNIFLRSKHFVTFIGQLEIFFS